MLPHAPGMPVRTYGALAGYGSAPLTNPLYSKAPMVGPGIPNVMPQLQPQPMDLMALLRQRRMGMGRGGGMGMPFHPGFTTPQGSLAAFGGMMPRMPYGA